MTREEVAEQLRRLITTSGYTQTAVASGTGIRQPELSQFMRRKVEFNDQSLEKLATFLGLTYRVERRLISGSIDIAHSR